MFRSLIHVFFFLSLPSVDGMMVYIPKDVPRKREELLGYLALMKASHPEQRQTEELESTKAHYEEAMTELHYTPEIQLLELLQEALMDNSTHPPAKLIERAGPSRAQSWAWLSRSSQAEALPGLEKWSIPEQLPRHVWSKVLVLEKCLWWLLLESRMLWARHMLRR